MYRLWSVDPGKSRLHVPSLVARAISVAAGVRSLIIGEIRGQEQLVVFGVRIVTVGSVHASSCNETCKSSSLPSR